MRTSTNRIRKLVCLVIAFVISIFPVPMSSLALEEDVSYYSVQDNLSYEAVTRITSSWDKHQNIEMTFEIPIEANYDEGYPFYEVVPDETYHITRNYYEPHGLYIFCHEYDSSDWAEENFKELVYEIFSWPLCKEYDEVSNGFCFSYSERSIVSVYLSDACTCRIVVKLYNHPEKLQDYYSICQELCWPYFDIESETIVYPEDLEDIDINTISEEVVESEENVIPEDTLEETQESVEDNM